MKCLIKIIFLQANSGITDATGTLVYCGCASFNSLFVLALFILFITVTEQTVQLNFAVEIEIQYELTECAIHLYLSTSGMYHMCTKQLQMSSKL